MKIHTAYISRNAVCGGHKFCFNSSVDLSVIAIQLLLCDVFLTTHTMSVIYKIIFLSVYIAHSYSTVHGQSYVAPNMKIETTRMTTVNGPEPEEIALLRVSNVVQGQRLSAIFALAHSFHAIFFV